MESTNAVRPAAKSPVAHNSVQLQPSPTNMLRKRKAEQGSDARWHSIVPRRAPWKPKNPRDPLLFPTGGPCGGPFRCSTTPLHDVPVGALSGFFSSFYNVTISAIQRSATSLPSMRSTAGGGAQCRNCPQGAVRAVTQAVAVKFTAETATPTAVRKAEEEMPRLWAVQCLKLQYRCHRGAG
jgi:bacterioferritin-associated ferredoxin